MSKPPDNIQYNESSGGNPDKKLERFVKALSKHKKAVGQNKISSTNIRNPGISITFRKWSLIRISFINPNFKPWLPDPSEIILDDPRFNKYMVKRDRILKSHY